MVVLVVLVDVVLVELVEGGMMVVVVVVERTMVADDCTRGLSELQAARPMPSSSAATPIDRFTPDSVATRLPGCKSPEGRFVHSPHGTARGEVSRGRGRPQRVR